MDTSNEIPRFKLILVGDGGCGKVELLSSRVQRQPSNGNVDYSRPRDLNASSQENF
jgi:GTPase SAR1 family protein